MEKSPQKIVLTYFHIQTTRETGKYIGKRINDKKEGLRMLFKKLFKLFW